MLPEVEKVFPVLRGRQDAIQNRDFKRTKVVDARLRVSRGGYTHNSRHLPIPRLSSTALAKEDSPFSINIGALANIDTAWLHLICNFIIISQSNTDP